MLVDQYFHSLEDLDRDFRKAMITAQIRPEIIYATEKTDRVVAKTNWDLLTDAEQEEWEDAVDEYFARVDAGETPEDILAQSPRSRGKKLSQQEEQIRTAFLENIYATVCHAGAFLDKAPRGKKYDEKAFLQYYLTARTIDAVRTAYRIFDERYSDDVWTLLRLIYESYIRTAFLRLQPDAAKFFFALSGTQAGTHQYFRTEKGKIDYRRIVEIETGTTVRNFTNREMAAAISVLDAEIYENLYPFLSSYSHVNLDTDFQYFDLSHGFRVHKEDDPSTALEFANIILSFWLEEISQVALVAKRTKRDLRYMVDRIRKFELFLMRNRPATMPPLVELLKQRLQTQFQ